MGEGHRPAASSHRPRSRAAGRSSGRRRRSAAAGERHAAKVRDASESCALTEINILGRRMKPLNVAFVWHMHQPYYKDDLTSTYLLPWVRLRCAKDYLKMPALLEGYPKVRATFNLVPSLLAQNEDYGKEEWVDLFLNLSTRAAGELSAEEREFVLRWMRESPRALRVQQSPRYLELASRLPDAQFTDKDIRDLQVWFNLAWCDPVWVESDPRLAELKRKDRDFTDEDKSILVEAQLERIR